MFKHKLNKHFINLNCMFILKLNTLTDKESTTVTTSNKSALSMDPFNSFSPHVKTWMAHRFVYLIRSVVLGRDILMSLTQYNFNQFPRYQKKKKNEQNNNNIANNEQGLEKQQGYL